MVELFGHGQTPASQVFRQALKVAKLTRNKTGNTSETSVKGNDYCRNLTGPGVEARGGYWHLEMKTELLDRKKIEDQRI